MPNDVIGHSVRGAPISCVESGAGADTVLIFGGIHGDEPESALVCERLAREIHPASRHVFIVAAANPDGLAARTKNNANDVDLNRNFAAQNFTVAHQPGYFPGAAPLSEPETRALAQLIDAAQPRCIVSVHQPFACVNWDGPARDLAHTMSEISGYPTQESIGYPTPGSFGSCYGVDRHIAVITLELSRSPSADELDRAVAALRFAALKGAPDGV